LIHQGTRMHTKGKEEQDVARMCHWRLARQCGEGMSHEETRMHTKEEGRQNVGCASAHHLGTCPPHRHPRESGGPSPSQRRPCQTQRWIPACAGMAGLGECPASSHWRTSRQWHKTAAGDGALQRTLRGPALGTSLSPLSLSHPSSCPFVFLRGSSVPCTGGQAASGTGHFPSSLLAPSSCPFV